MEVTLIGAIAHTLQARENCRMSGNDEWFEKHSARLKQLEQALPSGAGIDNGTRIDLTKSTHGKIVLTAGFHHMHESGLYDGWTEHVITVRPDWDGGLRLTISGRDRNQIKEYLHDTYYWALKAILPAQ